MKLKYMRERAGLTQEDVAKHLKVSQPTVSMWEKEKNGPKRQMLPAIAELYNCEINELF